MRDEKDFEGLQQQTARDHSLLKSRFPRPVDTNNELKHLLWQELALSKLIGGWIPAIPVYDQKVRLGRLCYLHNRNVKCLHERIMELPGGMKDSEWMSDRTKETFERIFGAKDENMFIASYFFLLKQMYIQY